MERVFEIWINCQDSKLKTIDTFLSFKFEDVYSEGLLKASRPRTLCGLRGDARQFPLRPRSGSLRAQNRERLALCRDASVVPVRVRVHLYGAAHSSDTGGPCPPPAQHSPSPPRPYTGNTIERNRLQRRRRGRLSGRSYPPTTLPGRFTTPDPTRMCESYAQIDPEP